VRGFELRDEKIVRDDVTFQKGSGRQPVEKARQVGILFVGERQVFEDEKP
jgi:hypothetical protein